MTKISIRLLICAMALVVFFLSGCGLAQQRALMRDKYPFYPEHIKRAIDGGYIVEGMDQEQVYLALGVTSCSSSSYYKGRNVVVWSYTPNPFTGRPAGGTYDCLRANQRVYFENGRVVGWDNM
jgi:outer membrane protein assembly factor BamE